MVPLGSLSRLRILSLGRNKIKAINGLDDVAGTLEELWISYNEITKLDGLASLQKLQKLYIARNLIESWDELDKIVRASRYSCLVMVTC